MKIILLATFSCMFLNVSENSQDISLNRHNTIKLYKFLSNTKSVDKYTFSNNKIESKITIKGDTVEINMPSLNININYHKYVIFERDNDTLFLRNTNIVSIKSISPSSITEC